VHVAITGAAGFVGSHLSERLVADGHSVVGIDNFDDFYDPIRKRRNVAGLLEGEGFTLAELDVRDRDALRPALAGADAVVHLAARAGVRPSFAAVDVYAQANIVAPVTLLELVSELEIPRLVFISSSTVYGEGAESPFREGGELGVPKSPYAATKVAGELLCQAFAHRIPSITILRLFSVYGPRQRPDLAIHKFARCIHAGEPIPVLGSTDSYRDYTYVDDVVAGIAAAVELNEPWTVLNIGSGSPVTLEEMISGLERVLGRRVGRRRLPPHPGDLFGTWAHTAEAERALGFRPRWTFERGVRRFGEWFLADEVNRLPSRVAA
jgi:UDP-glucuronate 4-epimerase